MHATAGQRVARRSDPTRERLAFTGGHFNHVAGHHPQRAQQLHVEGAQPGGPLGGLPRDGQELRDVRGVGEPLEMQQLGCLRELFGIEAGGLVGELRGGLHLRHGLRLDLLGGCTEKAPESATDAARPG